jgi:hypothetical protein
VQLLLQQQQQQAAAAAQRPTGATGSSVFTAGLTVPALHAAQQPGSAAPSATQSAATGGGGAPGTAADQAAPQQPLAGTGSVNFSALLDDL